jgi:rfaE bifunctional protein nucleotidyltransferase chain/domain
MAPGALHGSPDLDRVLGRATSVVVADYGRGVAAYPGVRHALVAAARGAPLIWDPHPRGPAPVAGTWLATPNLDEATRLAPAGRLDRGGGTADPVERDDPHLLEELARAGRSGQVLRRHWSLDRLVVTCGARGAVLALADDVLVLPTTAVRAADPCGAGDAFAVGAAFAAGRTSVPEEVVAAAIAHARQYLLDGGPAGLSGTVRTLLAPRAWHGHVPSAIDDVRRAGGRIVATSGCFDLLHPGHIAMLRAARALGDALVVLLNSDASVRRLKGPTRPVQCQGDRAAVLEALSMVDGVVVFEEETPVQALERLRPQLFVKGGDYAGVDLPERAAMAQWGGDVVIVPFVGGHSTTRLVHEASRAS